MYVSANKQFFNTLFAFYFQNILLLHLQAENETWTVENVEDGRKVLIKTKKGQKLLCCRPILQDADSKYLIISSTCKDFLRSAGLPNILDLKIDLLWPCQFVKPQLLSIFEPFWVQNADLGDTLHALLRLVKHFLLWKSNDIQVKLDDTNLQKVSSTKFLRVIIDENHTWKNHIDGVSKTIARNVGALNKLKCYIPKQVLHSLYY